MIDLTKPYQTRDGRRAFATVGPDGRLYGWAVQPGGEEYDAESWEADGRYYPPTAEFGNGRNPSAWDLVNVSEVVTTTVWIDIYRRAGGGTYFGSSSTRADADTIAAALTVEAGLTRIACISREITYVEGEGL